jgi:hypothetical protein
MTSRDLTIQKGRLSYTFTFKEVDGVISYLLEVGFDGEEINKIFFTRFKPCSPFLYLLKNGSKVCTLPFLDFEVERLKLWSWNLISQAMEKRVS